MTSNDQHPLPAIAQDYWDGVLRRDPITATFYGDHRYRERLPDAGPIGRTETASAMAGLLRRLEAIDTQQLSTTDLVTFEMLRRIGEDELTGLALGVEQTAVDQLSGPQIWLTELVGWHRLTEPGDPEALITRFTEFPGYLREYTANLRQGMLNRRLAFGVVVDRVIGQLEGILGTPPAESPLVPRNRVAPAAAEQIATAVELAVYPAYRQLLDFLRDEYRPKARNEAGIGSLPGGADLYAYLVRVHTTTDLTPDEIHRIGLEELSQIEAEAQTIGERLGIPSKLGDIVRHLNDLAENIPVSRGAIVDASERLLREIGDRLPAAFGLLPKTPCTVKPIEAYREADAPGAYYYPPAPDGSRPGVFYVNTFRPETRPYHGLAALVAHEGVPGHHLQIALAQEAAGLPTFRRLSTGCTAFVEGWALYSERLAGELGLYENDRDRIGMLEAQAWRAVRLVVDTGIHHRGWSRERAADFFREHVGSHDLEAAVEIDRYIAWPGQALAYKIGQREIERLRREASTRLGSSWRLQTFHGEVLRHGPVPLSALERIVDRWIAAQAGVR